MAIDSGAGTVSRSFLDRLIDEDPARSAEAPMSGAQSLRELKVSVRRDLEWLLNTRRNIEEPPSEESELARSLFVYGLPDVCSTNLGSARERIRLAREIEKVIAYFEPRLADVKVTLPRTRGATIPEVRFIIEAMLRADPAPEAVRFDTVLDVSTGEYAVKGEAGAR